MADSPLEGFKGILGPKGQQETPQLIKENVIETLNTIHKSISQYLNMSNQNIIAFKDISVQKIREQDADILIATKTANDQKKKYNALYDNLRRLEYKYRNLQFQRKKAQPKEVNTKYPALSLAAIILGALGYYLYKKFMDFKNKLNTLLQKDTVEEAAQKDEPKKKEEPKKDTPTPQDNLEVKASTGTIEGEFIDIQAFFEITMKAHEIVIEAEQEIVIDAPSIEFSTNPIVDDGKWEKGTETAKQFEPKAVDRPPPVGPTQTWDEGAAAAGAAGSAAGPSPNPEPKAPDSNDQMFGLPPITPENANPLNIQPKQTSQTGPSAPLSTPAAAPPAPLSTPAAKDGPATIVKAEITGKHATGGHDTGTITLPGTTPDEKPRTFKFETGGGGAGAAPETSYEIGETMDRGVGLGPGTLGQRQVLTEIGQPHDTARDPTNPVKQTRSELRIHEGFGGQTLGCIGILGGHKVYEDFQRRLLYLMDKSGGKTILRVGSPEAQTIMEKMDPPPAKNEVVKADVDAISKPSITGNAQVPKQAEPTGDAKSVEQLSEQEETPKQQQQSEPQESSQESKSSEAAPAPPTPPNSPPADASPTPPPTPPRDGDQIKPPAGTPQQEQKKEGPAQKPQTPAKETKEQEEVSDMGSPTDDPEQEDQMPASGSYGEKSSQDHNSGICVI